MAKKRSSSRKRAVLTLLLASVFAPILLYTDRRSGLSDSASNSELTEGLNLVSRYDIAKLSVIIQDTTGAVHEPIHEAYTENSTNFSTKSKVASEKLTSEAEHKSRLLSAMNEVSESENYEISEKSQNDKHNKQSQFKKDSNILQVAGGGITDNGFEETTTVEKIKESGVVRVQRLAVRLNQEQKQDKPSEEVNMRTEPDNKYSSKTTTLPNSMVLQMRDQLMRAKVYLGLRSSRSHPTFIRELRSRMREIQRVLGDATRDSELPNNAYQKLKAMEEILSKGKLIQENCSVAIKKLRAILHSTEEQLRVHKKQTTFLSQLAAKTVPKGLHCLSLQLTNEYYMNGFDRKEVTNQDKLEDDELYHYAIFSDNVLATACVVNSTVFHAKDPEKHVFHIVTDKLNYAAIKMWFISNPPGNCTIEIQSIEDFRWLTSRYSPVLKQLESKSMVEYYFKSNSANSDENLKYHNPKYLSILNHLRFYLPEIFPKLNKVLFLDDDVVVQKDLSALWSVDLKGKVIGVVETCGESFHRFNRYLNFSNPVIAQNFDPRACGWAFGMNVFDLAEWRRQNITNVYHFWQNLNQERLLWKLGTLPVGLVTFWNHTLPLDQSWHLLGLGYNPNINHKDIEKAAVIHFNGNLKPWLEIGLLEYRNYWSKYVDHDQVYLRQCNINL